MDELGARLREDAANIEAEVSTELDTRIRASLENVTPAEGEKPQARPVSTWWVSGLGGAAAAAVILLLVNLDRPQPPHVPTDNRPPPVEPLVVLELKAEAAVLTQPLKKELENLESDIRKAERAVREEIGLSL